MTMKEILAIAKRYGLEAGGLSKVDLIKSIQRQEHNYDCFATADQGECNQANCCWRQDCFESATKEVML